MYLERHKIRLKIDAANPHLSALDFYTRKRPILWVGGDTQIELGIFHENEPYDLSPFDSLTVEIFSQNIFHNGLPGVPLLSRTIPSWQLNNDLTPYTWEKGLVAHGIISFDHGTAHIQATGKNGWHLLSVSAQTKDSPANTIPLGIAELIVLQEGSGTAGSPPDGNINYLTKCQMDARYPRVLITGYNFQWAQLEANGDLIFQLKNKDTGQFHSLWSADGGLTYLIDAAQPPFSASYLPSFDITCADIIGNPLPLNVNYFTKDESDELFLVLTPENGWYRFKKEGVSYYFQLWNPDQSKWHTVWVTGQPNTENILIEAGED